jgi:hypothetical protein
MKIVYKINFAVLTKLPKFPYFFKSRYDTKKPETKKNIEVTLFVSYQLPP